MSLLSQGILKMSEQTVTLNLPEPLYLKLKERAEQKKHSLETELMEVVVTAVPVSDELPPVLAEALNALTLQNDRNLWKSARSKVSKKDQARFRALQSMRKEQGLTQVEVVELTNLRTEFDRVMLVRARAAVLLKERGFDISELGPKK